MQKDKANNTKSTTQSQQALQARLKRSRKLFKKIKQDSLKRKSQPREIVSPDETIGPGELKIAPKPRLAPKYRTWSGTQIRTQKPMRVTELPDKVPQAFSSTEPKSKFHPVHNDLMASPRGMPKTEIEKAITKIANDAIAKHVRIKPGYQLYKLTEFVALEKKKMIKEYIKQSLENSSRDKRDIIDPLLQARLVLAIAESDIIEADLSEIINGVLNQTNKSLTFCGH